MTHFYKLILFIVLFLNSLTGFSQKTFTPYDELPGLNPSEKPAYNNNYPSWGKMLYQYPVNFNTICAEFDNYMVLNPGLKNEIIRYFKNWRRAMVPYVAEDGVIIIPDLVANAERLKSAQLGASKNLKSTQANNSEWTFLGPKQTFWLNESGSGFVQTACPWQVNVYSFDVSASNNNILYCGTETGFVNKTIDKGLNWQLLGTNYPFGGAVTAVTIHPANPDTVIVAAGKQIHKTVDGGITWTPKLTSVIFGANRVKINPVSPNIVIASTSEGVFISFDSGETWLKKWAESAWDVEFRPDNPNTIYAISKNSSNNYTVIISTNGGNTFSEISTFPSNIVQSSGGLLAVTPANPDIIFAIMLPPVIAPNTKGAPLLYKGTWSGSAWTWNLVATGLTGALELDNGQGYFDLILEVAPYDQSIIFAGTTTLYRSINGGATFIPIGGYKGSFSIHPDIQDFKILPSGETWVSTDGGFTLTTDNFVTLAGASTRINGLIGSDMWGFDQGWNEDLIVGGRYHNGNTAIADFYQPKSLRMGGAESATGWVIQGKSRYVAYNDLGNGWILPKTAEGQPEGRFIFSKYPNMDEYGGRRSNFITHPNYYGEFYIGESTGFWKSIDMGVSYDLLYTFPDKVYCIQNSYSNPDVFYADVAGTGLYKSTDGGKSWISKPSLTSSTYAGSTWRGRTNIVISPYNENLIYASYSNGTWYGSIGKIFRSINGGETWEDWTGSVTGYTKCLAIQPTLEETDLVYLFTLPRYGASAKVYYRKAGMADWEDYSNDYPVGMDVNLALPFFRDSKIRVGGSGSVWESPLAEPNFKPIINPWIEKRKYNCMLDTLYFEDHSMLNHSGATWEWKINPSPEFIDNTKIRNPKVVLGTPGKYSVTMELTVDGLTYTKTITDMVETTTCPSVDDCGNPAELPKTDWKLLFVDSQEPGTAINAFDGDMNTIWHTRWSTGTDPYPHEIQVDMGTLYKISKFIYLPRQIGTNGRIKDYELYISNDKVNWGSAVKTGSFTNSSAPQVIDFGISTPKSGRYFRLKTLSEVNGGPWTSAAELSAVGCINTVGIEDNIINPAVAYPVPTTGLLTVILPFNETPGKISYTIFSFTGMIVDNGSFENSGSTLSFDLTKHATGMYFIRLVDKDGIIYRVKVQKQ